MAERLRAQTRQCLQSIAKSLHSQSAIVALFKSPDKKNRYPLKDFPEAGQALAALESRPVFDDGRTQAPLQHLSQFLQK
ncbi:hypothetical protein [Pseudomonas putida]|uniref:hypothetical protein n=1 Tax=Pseudomonas putida TaxID=303 RepID=UPI003D95FD10